MKTTQRKIAKSLGISESYLSLLLNGKKHLSWFLAEKLTNMFPEKDITTWKRSTPEDIKEAFKD